MGITSYRCDCSIQKIVHLGCLTSEFKCVCGVISKMDTRGASGSTVKVTVTERDSTSLNSMYLHNTPVRIPSMLPRSSLPSTLHPLVPRLPRPVILSPIPHVPNSWLDNDSDDDTPPNVSPVQMHEDDIQDVLSYMMRHRQPPL